MNEKKTYEFDVVTEYMPIEKSVARLKKAIPNAIVKMHVDPSPGGGWSWLFVTIDPKDEQTLRAWYYGDAEEAAHYDDVDHETMKSAAFLANEKKFKTF